MHLFHLLCVSILLHYLSLHSPLYFQNLNIVNFVAHAKHGDFLLVKKIRKNGSLVRRGSSAFKFEFDMVALEIRTIHVVSFKDFQFGSMEPISWSID